MIKEREYIIMKGFVKNEGDKGIFILQRTLYPGAMLSFDEAYLSVGEKSGKKKGAPFVKWLRDNYLSATQWVFYKEDGIPYFGQEELAEMIDPPAEVALPAKGAGRVMRRNLMMLKVPRSRQAPLLKGHILMLKSLLISVPTETF